MLRNAVNELANGHILEPRRPPLRAGAISSHTAYPSCSSGRSLAKGVSACSGLDTPLSLSWGIFLFRKNVVSPTESRGVTLMVAPSADH